MIVLGIDPGTRKCGYAVLDLASSHMRVLTFGAWNLMGKDPKRNLGERLEELHENSLLLLKEYNPRIVGLEKAVSFKSVPSSFTLTEARGVLRLALFQSLDRAEERLVELSPTQVKRAATGSGASPKEAIQKMLCMRFKELTAHADSRDFTSDAFDAVAVAWAAWIVRKSQNTLSIPRDSSL